MELFKNIKLQLPEDITLFSDLNTKTPRAEYRTAVLQAADEAGAIRCASTDLKFYRSQLG